jgi:ABC-type branched-subunit amino acid transport system substrate-binding protein
MRSGLLLTLLAVFSRLVTVTSLTAGTLDDRPEVVTEFVRGERMLGEGDYLEASRLFARLAERFPDSKNLDLFLFNQAKADLYFGDYAAALHGFDTFIRRYPQSEMIAHAHFFLGNGYYLKNELSRATGSYVTAFRLSHDPRLDDLVVASMVEAVTRADSVSLGPGDFKEIEAARRCRLVEPVAQALTTRQDFAAAGNLMTLCGGKTVRDSARTGSASAFEIAVLLPLSGELGSFGEEIFHGATIAAEQYRRESRAEVTLVPYDTKGYPVDAARLARDLAAGNTDAIVGPLTSEEAAVVSAALGGERLPLISPAATQAGLTELSEGTFQLSPNIELQGVVAAEFAVLARHADSAAIIAPTSADHVRMARAFTERFEALGGTVVAAEYYRPRDRDFGQYLRDLKATLLGAVPDSAVYINDNGDTLDVEAVPVKLDCLYLPGVADQLRLLLPQIAYNTIDAFYLGSDGWGDDAIYRLGDNVTKRAVFPSPFLEQERTQEYVRFATEYDTRYGAQPQRLACLGYDAVRLLTLALKGGAKSRVEVIARLALVDEYPGAAGPVTFGENRENIELPLYQLINGTPVLLGRGGDQKTEGTK